MTTRRRSRLLGVAITLIALVLGFGLVHAAAPGGGRPLVLVIHGRGLLGRDTSALRREWQSALERGVRAVGGGSMLHDGDVRLVWYADVLDPAVNWPCASDDTRRGRLESGESSAQDVLGVLSTLLTWAAGGADAARGADSLELRSFLGDLLYVADARRRCGAEQRLSTALADARAERRPVVLVAHSFGSLVAYGYLSRARESAGPERAIERFVTIGSLLGDDGIRELLFGPTASRRLELPAGVRSWINIRRANDPFAAPVVPDGATGSAQLKDVLLESAAVPGGPHEVVGYLSDPATARAVLGAWCAAFAEPTDRPPGCAVMQVR